ncbi:MAG: T9SS type A sorting domain-containing protein [Bacteroidales bacterium]
MKLCKSLLLLLLIIKGSILCAQTPERFYHYGNHWDDEVYTIKELSDGLFLVAGNSSKGSFSKSWIYKLDQNGNATDSLVQNSDVIGWSIVEFYKLDNYYIGIGMIDSAEDETKSLYYLKTDSNLNIVEEKMYPIELIVGSNFRVRTDFNNFYIFGYVKNQFDEYDMMAMILDRNGNLINQKIWYMPNPQFIFDFLLNDDGSFYIFSYGYSGQARLKISDSLLVIDTLAMNYPVYFNTTVDWLTDTSYLYAGKGGEDALSEMAVAGKSTAKEIKCDQDKSFDDMSITLFDTSHNVLKFEAFGKPDTNEYCFNYKSLDYFDKNNIYITATSNFTVGSLYQEYDNEVLVVNLDSTLTPRWEKYIGGDAYYNVFNLTALQDGGVVLACRRHDYREHVGEMDVCLFRLDAEGNLMASTELHPHSSGFEIYPNPVHDRLYINGLRTYRDAEVKVYNASGQLMLQEKLHEDYLDVASLPKGFYLLKIHSEDEIFVQKFVKK